MKPRRAHLLAAAACAALACEARAQLVYESFNYTAGLNLDTHVNPGNSLTWSAMGSTPADEITVTSPSVSYPGLPPATGNSVSYASTGNSQRLAIGPVLSTGTTYYSLTMNVTGLGAMTTSPTFIAGFSPGVGASGIAPTTIGTRLYLRKSGAGFNVGVSKNSNTLADITFDGTIFPVNTLLFIVGSYTINGTTLGTDDDAKLWINPTALGAAAAPSTLLTAPANGTDLFASGAPSVAGIVLRQGSLVPDVSVDELRIDSTWAQVTPPAGITWNTDSSGNWTDDAKWSSGVSPNDPNNFVNLGNAILQPRVITVDTPVSLRTLNFNSAQPYSLIGADALNFSTSAAMNVFGGTHTVAVPVTAAGDLLLSVASNSALLLSADIAPLPGALTKAGAGFVQVNNVRAAALNLYGGRMSVFPNGGPAGASKVNALAVTPGATLDLADNSIAVDYPGASPIGSWDGSAYTGITGLLQSGRGDGSWTGTGMITSMTDAGGSVLTTLAVGEASDVLGLTAGQTALWKGQTVDASTVLVKYTWGGDADLNGELNGDDYFYIDSHVLQSGSVFGFHNGDFNYDGVINGDDYFILDSNILQAQGIAPFSDSAAAGLTAVPEPSIAALALGLALTRRRRVATAHRIPRAS